MSSLLMYWWMGLAMIGITVFIIYNSVLAVAIIPPHRYNKIQHKENPVTDAPMKSISQKSDVYMHVIVAENETIDIPFYLSYIEIISKKYHSYQYNLLVLINDTFLNESNLSDYENNEIALDSLWKEKKMKMKSKSFDNIRVRYKPLSQFMDKSPLKKYWRRLPNKFIPFFVRCISIWNKGGISINPSVLTPQSPHPNYMSKVKNILEISEGSKYFKKSPKKVFRPKIKKKVNNIRDIIEALENDNATDYDQTHLSLDEEENVAVSIKVTKDDKYANFPTKLVEMGKTNSGINDTRKYSLLRRQTRKSLDIFHDIVNKKNQASNEEDAEAKNKTHYQKILPMFFKYILPISNWTQPADDDRKKNVHSNINTTSYDEKPVSSISRETNKIKGSVSVIEPQMMPDEYLIDRVNHTAVNNNRSPDLRIDLKGNIVATNVPCHAFLGTIFNNAIHFIREETVTDFIISELSFFCNGVWSSCKGVDVILV
ncbi:unnamed protein product [Leptidea sinapis]|uniref:Uncharacterized protein n=1 Tax=Leptidea sinapis TaxID=189913 RepID=A0A5E4QS92_9NEOP|nr:unnamed protein product [Leptidea sinapis]